MAPGLTDRHARVHRGCLRLAECRAGWPWGIDTSRLVVGDHRWGVLGQIFAERAGPHADPHKLGLRLLGVPPGHAVDFGFEPRDDEDADLLGQIWSVDLMTLRVESQVRPPLPLHR